MKRRRNEPQLVSNRQTHLAWRSAALPEGRALPLPLFNGEEVAEVLALFEAAGNRGAELAPKLAAALKGGQAADRATRLQATAEFFGTANMASRVMTRSLWATARVPDHPEWSVAYRLIPQDDVPVVAELRILPSTEVNRNGLPTEDWRADSAETIARTPANGLTSKVVRKLVLGADLIASQKVMNKMERPPKNHAFEPSGIFGEHGFTRAPGAIRSRRDQKGARKRGRVGFGERFYAKIARDYVRAWTQNRTNPIARLADYRGLKTSRARDMVRRARELDLLTQGRPGRPGGQLTDKARELLSKRPRT